MYRWMVFHLYACWENPKPLKITLRVAARFIKTLGSFQTPESKNKPGIGTFGCSSVWSVVFPDFTFGSSGVFKILQKRKQRKQLVLSHFRRIHRVSVTGIEFHGELKAP